MAGLAQDPYTFGFVSGALFVLALTPLFFWISIWLKSIKSFFKPQAVVHTTKKSPFGVMISALWNTLITTLVFVVMAAFIFLYFKFLS